MTDTMMISRFFIAILSIRLGNGVFVFNMQRLEALLWNRMIISKITRSGIDNLDLSSLFQNFGDNFL